jgi:hypothetical protein
MGFATHLGPWLLGTVKNTTGTSAGTIQNLGASIVAQTKSVAYNDADSTQAFVLPAGALITSMQFITTTTFTAATTITVSVSGTAVSGAATITTAGANAIASATTTAAAALLNNVGSTDAIVTYTVAEGASSAGAGTLVIAYIVRGSDGVMYPSATQA